MFVQGNLLVGKQQLTVTILLISAKRSRQCLLIFKKFIILKEIYRLENQLTKNLNFHSILNLCCEESSFTEI